MTCGSLWSDGSCIPLSLLMIVTRSLTTYNDSLKKLNIVTVSHLVHYGLSHECLIKLLPLLSTKQVFWVKKINPWGANTPKLKTSPSVMYQEYTHINWELTCFKQYYSSYRSHSRTVTRPILCMFGNYICNLWPFLMAAVYSITIAHDRYPAFSKVNSLPIVGVSHTLLLHSQINDSH